MDKKLNVILVLVVLSTVFSAFITLVTLRQVGLKGLASHASFGMLDDEAGGGPRGCTTDSGYTGEVVIVTSGGRNREACHYVDSRGDHYTFFFH